MEEIDIFNQLNHIEDNVQMSLFFEDEKERAEQIAKHLAWMKSIRHERPSTATPYKAGIYIRYFNQTKYEDYLHYHKKQFSDVMALCPIWELVDFYVDEGNNAPNMESAPEWCRLLNDCFAGKVDLIITQKVSNISRKAHELTLCARLLASQRHPIGIYFISEDLFTLAGYYLDDMRDPAFFPSPDWKILPDEDLLEKLEALYE